MSFEDKRKIVQTAFGGKDFEGNRCGVYVNKPDKAVEPVTYEIKGVFTDIQGQLPMPLKDAQQILGLGSEGKQDTLSKRHAHYSFCVH
jgi:hypothetical protein